MQINRSAGLILFLLATAAALAVASAFFLSAMFSEIRSLQGEFRRNLPHYASQVDYEVFQLIDSVLRFGEGEPGISRDDVILRVDIVWSRLLNDAKTGPSASYFGLEGAVDAIESLKSTLAEVEEDILAMNSGDHEIALDVANKLRSELPDIHSLSMAAIKVDASASAIYYERQLFNARYGIAFISGFLLFSSTLIFVVVLDRRRIRNLNQELEKFAARQKLEIASEKENRLTAEGDLADRNERLRQAAQLVKLGNWEWDCLTETCEYCSDLYASAYGLTVQDYRDHVSQKGDRFSLVSPSDRKRVAAQYDELRRGKIIEVEYSIDTPGGPRRIHEVARPVFDQSGQVVRELGSSIDVTEQRETEKQLVESRKMDAIGQLTGGIAHDFNNLLAVIMGNLELIEAETDPKQQSEMISDALAATIRGRDLTMSMLNFARRAPLTPKPMDINQAIRNLEILVRRVLPENITIETALGAGLWTVLADRSSTESALLNLCLNARDAMPNGGKLTIETTNMRVDQDYIDDRAETVDPGRYVMVAVTDTGSGIPSEKFGDIFEPFYTTKGVGEGSGLGLSMVQGFAKQSGGTVHVYSELGVGTTFKLYLKTVHDPDKELARSPKPIERSIPHGLRVLLVEDEEKVRKVVANLLASEGADVVEAEESAGAERAFKTKGHFDLLLTDIVMPGDLQGTGLARRLREIEPDLPVVFMSGYPNEAKVHGNGLRPEDVRLMKPVSRRELCQAVLHAVQTRKYDHS